MIKQALKPFYVVKIVLNGIRYVNTTRWENAISGESFDNYISHSPAELKMHTWTVVWRLHSCRIPYFAEFLKPDAINFIYPVLLKAVVDRKLIFLLLIISNYTCLIIFLRKKIWTVRSQQTSKHCADYTKLWWNFTLKCRLSYAHFSRYFPIFRRIKSINIFILNFKLIFHKKLYTLNYNINAILDIPDKYINFIFFH